MADHGVAAVEGIERAIRVLRGHRVLLDADLAHLYGVEAKALNQAVKRNAERFPSDFMFQLTLEEAQSSRSQTVTLNRGANIKYLPFAFTEQGVVMLSSVLARKLTALEKKYDAQFKVVFDAIRELMEPPAKPKRRIGFGGDAG